jgi:hypothetical protein
MAARSKLAPNDDHVWLIDPWTSAGRVCDALSWRESSRLEVGGTPIYVDLDEVFDQLSSDCA